MNTHRIDIGGGTVRTRVITPMCPVNLTRVEVKGGGEGYYLPMRILPAQRVSDAPGNNITNEVVAGEPAVEGMQFKRATQCPLRIAFPTDYRLLVVGPPGSE